MSDTSDGGTTWGSEEGGDGFDCEIVNDLSFEFWFASALYPPPGTWIFRQRASGAAPTNNLAEGMDGLFYSRYLNRMYAIGDDDKIYASDVGATSLSWFIDGTIPSPFRMRRAPTGSYVDDLTLYGNTTDLIDEVGIPTAVIMQLSGGWNTSTYDFGGSGSVRNLYASTENAREVWATKSRYAPGEPLIFHSTDRGATWTDVTGNLTRSSRPTAAGSTRTGSRASPSSTSTKTRPVRSRTVPTTIRTTRSRRDGRLSPPADRSVCMEAPTRQDRSHSTRL